MKTLLTLLTLFFAQFAIAQSEQMTLDSTPYKIVDTFFTKASVAGWDVAVNYISTLTPPSISKTQLLNVSTLIKQHKDGWGKLEGYEFITSRKINSTVIATNCLARFDYDPIKFTFIFYKAKDKWRVVEFKLDDQLNEEMLDFLKFYLLDTDTKK